MSDQEKLNQVIDTLLRYRGTPRERLYEYPYNEHESRQILRSAEDAARSIARIFDAGK